MPTSLEKTTKKEINRLSNIGVLKKDHESEWAAPTFVQPKKTGDIRILTDFRKLNDKLKRKPFPLPKIADILQKLAGFKYATAIDLSMGYYHIPLDEESQKLCTTILPWGKYKYLRLPMGIKNSPDIFQAIMMQLLGDLDNARTYIDDILITSDGTFEEHLQHVHEVLSRLEKAGFRANVRKCFFAKPEIEYLGYWLMQKGIQPQPKKVEAILRLNPPKTKRQLRHFLGMVNYYRDMWQKRSHILAPLTGMVSEVATWKWGKEQQQAFEEMKRVISQETLLTFPDFEKPFHIYTDASNYQLGAVIMQNDKPLAFYSRKLNSAQKNYTTGEQELLSIVETLKEFRNILWGQEIIVHTDHINIVYGKLSNERITRWRLLLEEFGPQYVHVRGKDNVVADVLSRMEANFDEVQSPPEICACALTALESNEGFKMSKKKKNIAKLSDDKTLIEAEVFPLAPNVIEQYQRNDKELSKLRSKQTSHWSTKVIEENTLALYKNKIFIPKPLRDRIVTWYHAYLSHPGQTRMERTLAQTILAKNVRYYQSTCEDMSRVPENQRPT